MPSYVLKNKVREYYKYVTEAFDFVKEGTRSNSGWQSVNQGTNYLYGYSNAYEMGQNAGTSLVWTYNDTIPASTYTFNIKTNGQGNGYINNLTVTVTYDDSTTEVVYTNTESWNSDTLNEDFTFVASKPIKVIKVTGTLTHTSMNYVGIGITLTSLTHLGGQKSTSSDYDYYVYSTKSYILKRKINKYYRDTVTTKYWKEVETITRELEYACYEVFAGTNYNYVKVPFGSDSNKLYWSNTGLAASSADFGGSDVYLSVTEEQLKDLVFTSPRYTEGDLYKETTTTEVVEGTPDDYTYTTTETETVEVSANDDYDRVVADSEPAYFLTQRGNWQPVYEDYTLPKMTSRTAPEGAVSTNIGNGEYTIDAYNFFFNRSWYFEAEGREGSRYNRYTFAKPLKPDTYTISFGGNLQQQDSNSGTLSVWYDDGTIETLITYTLSTAGQTFSKTFTATKPIRTISIDMTVGRRDNKNDVTTFYGLNIVSETGQLQVFTGYKQDKE